MPDAVPAFVWVEGLTDPGSQVILDSAAAHHVIRVCRARIGDSVTATDGRGAIAGCRVTHLTPEVRLEVGTVDRIERDRTAVVLCGAPEGQRFDWLVEKLAELGIARVRPVECERGAWPRAAVRPERWKRLAVAALEQSRGRFLLEVESPMGLEEALRAEGHKDPGGTPALGILTDPEGIPPAQVDTTTARTVVAAVGPASGFSAEERASLLGRGFIAMSLSQSRLRTETAALAWAAWWAAPQKA